MASDPGERGRPTLPEPIDAAALFGRSGAPKPVLVVLTGPQVGQRIRVEEPATIGRDPMCDLMLTDDSVEWHHARVEPSAEGWQVVDLTGARRTEVNGMRVAKLLLSPDDQIILGHTVVRFEVHDQIEQAYDEAVLERLYKDELTGLLARRKYDIELRSALGAAAREGEALAVLVIDVDRLKRVNDLHGHLVGARVIADVGGIVGDVVRERAGARGLACRMGGDEFGVALAGADAERAAHLAEVVRERVAAARLEHDGVRLDVRVSTGISLFPRHGRTALELLRHADEALYAAKREGGDRTVVWS